MVTTPTHAHRLDGARHLLYTNECVGLGHLRRTMTLAEAITRRDAHASALVITGATTTLGEGRHPRIDTVKLPELARARDGGLQAARLRVDLPQVHSLRANLALTAAMSFAPSVALIDKAPLGLERELVPTLQALRLDGGTRIVLGLRDIEDTPNAVSRRWSASRLRDTIEQFYDAILVYGPGTPGNALNCLGIDDIDLPVHHVGYVGSELPATGPTDLPPGYLLVTAGGGADGYPVFDAVLGSLAEHPQSVPVVMVLGPLMPAAHRKRLHARGAAQRVRVEDARDDMQSVIVGSRAVIAMAGYNTVAEVVRARRPLLLVPRERPSGEQLLRASAFRAAGTAGVLTLGDATPAGMGREIEVLLRRDAPTYDPALHDGAATAADILCGLADEVESARRAQEPTELVPVLAG